MSEEEKVVCYRDDCRHNHSEECKCTHPNPEENGEWCRSFILKEDRCVRK